MMKPWNVRLVMLVTVLAAVLAAMGGCRSADEEKSTHVQSLLLSAAQNGDVEAMSQLKEQGADVNAIDNDGATPLSCANNEAAKAWLRANGAK